MRITNRMMINSSMANIQVNKNQMNTMSDQLSTQKKISKPSDDPVVAIRALRLRSSLDQVTQYLNKNIPDASSWLSVTDDALKEAYDIVTDLYGYCNQASTDSYSTSERNTLIGSLNALRTTFYKQGDVEYAGRYVYTGFYTDTPLTYQSDLDAADEDYTITQEFTRDNLEDKKVYTNPYSNQDILSLNVITPEPDVTTVHRVQIAYRDIKEGSLSLKDKDGNALSYTSTTDVNPQPGDNDIIVNEQTGEIFLGENVFQKMYTDNAFSITYDKNNFKKDDLNPVMYFTCTDNNTNIEYVREDQDINYNINFSQKLKVNSEASKCFDIYLGRNLDDMTNAVQNVTDIEKQIAQVESMMKEEQYKDETSQEKLASIKTGLQKQLDMANDNMTAAFEKGIQQMQDFQTQISDQRADVGNRQVRLELTKARLSEQKTNFTELKSSNEDIDLEEVVVNYSSAELVYNASLNSASKVVKQSLLDFL